MVDFFTKKGAPAIVSMYLPVFSFSVSCSCFLPPTETSLHVGIARCSLLACGGALGAHLFSFCSRPSSHSQSISQLPAAGFLFLLLLARFPAFIDYIGCVLEKVSILSCLALLRSCAEVHVQPISLIFSLMICMRSADSWSSIETLLQPGCECGTCTQVFIAPIA